MGDAGIVKDPLRGGRLSRIDVGHDANISDLFF
jgi:hypothetical protein